MLLSTLLHLNVQIRFGTGAWRSRMLEKEFGGTWREEEVAGELEELGSGGRQERSWKKPMEGPWRRVEDNGELARKQDSLLFGHTSHGVTFKLRKRLCPIWLSAVFPRECSLGGRDDQDTGYFWGLRTPGPRINKFIHIVIWMGFG